MSQIYIPTLLFWENGNTWYGSDRQARFFIRPVKPEEKEPRLEVELWRGPLTKELSQVLDTAAFPVSEEGLSQLTGWLEEASARLNGAGQPGEKIPVK